MRAASLHVDMTFLRTVSLHRVLAMPALAAWWLFGQEAGEESGTSIDLVRARRVCGFMEGDEERLPLEPCGTIYELTGNEHLARWGGELIPATLRITLIVALALLLSWLLRRAINRFVGGLKNKALERIGARQDAGTSATTRATARTETIGGVLRSVATVAVWSMAVLMVLGEVGINLGPLIAGAGVAGIALGFGAQRLVQDFLTGLFMIIEDQYGIGDIVDIGEANGIVEAVTLRTTRIRDVQGTLWHVPNGEIRRVGNKSQEWARALLDVGVAYDSDIGQVTEILQRVTTELAAEPEWSSYFVAEPEVWGVHDFGPNEVIVRLVMKVAPAMQWKVEREARARIKHAFDAEGVEIPFPQRTLWIRREDDPSPLERPTAAERPTKTAAKKASKRTRKA